MRMHLLSLLVNASIMNTRSAFKSIYIINADKTKQTVQQLSDKCACMLWRLLQNSQALFYLLESFQSFHSAKQSMADYLFIKH